MGALAGAFEQPVEEVVDQFGEGLLGPGMRPQVLLDPKSDVGVLSVEEPQSTRLGAAHHMSESFDWNQLNSIVERPGDASEYNCDREEDAAEDFKNVGVESVD